jgi:hypothetical protein
MQMFKYKRVKIESHSSILFECTAIIQRIPHHIYTEFVEGYSLLRTIRDVWDEEILNLKDSMQIYNSLFDKRKRIG